MFKRIVVTNKWTYLLLLLPIGSAIKIIYDAFNLLPEELYVFLNNFFIAAIVGALGAYLFVRLNTHSAWHNPDHPKSRDNK